MGAGDGLQLFNVRSGMLFHVGPARGDNGAVNGDIIWAGDFDVGGGVCVVVWLDVRGNGVAEVEVGPADAGRGVVAGVERGRATEDDGDDRVPRQQAGRLASSRLASSRGSADGSHRQRTGQRG
jgi:hypothetical protein